MIKHLRKLIAIILTMAIFSQMLTAYAASFDSTSSVLSNPSIFNVNISMIADTIMGDPAATDVQISENVLTYKMNGTTNVRITETIDNNTHYFDIIEGEIHNNVSINVAQNIITLNGTPLSIRISQDTFRIPNENSMVTSSTNWVYSGTRYVNIVAEDAIKNLAVNTLLALICGAMGTIGVTLGLVQLLLKAYVDVNSPSNLVYVTRTTYFEEHYWAYKYIDTYYCNVRDDIIEPVQTVTTEHWE